MGHLFQDRSEAGRALATHLLAYDGRPDVLVLGLPRGGVPVAYEIADRLNLPLDVLLVRKLGLPGVEEVAMGAIASGGARVLNREAIDAFGVSSDVVSHVIETEQRELDRRAEAYRGERPDPVVTGRTIIVLDDGLATGATMQAAAEALAQQNPTRLVAAAPVGAPDSVQRITGVADEVVCPHRPADFRGVGQFYRDFEATRDEEVVRLLEQAWQRAGTAAW